MPPKPVMQRRPDPAVIRAMMGLLLDNGWSNWQSMKWGKWQPNIIAKWSVLWVGDGPSRICNIELGYLILMVQQQTT